MNSQSNPWIGATLCGRYQVLSLLKEGGMASLYFAQDFRGQQFVVKTPPPGLDPGTELLGLIYDDA